MWWSQVAETLTLYAHKWECPHVNDKWSPLKLVTSHWFSVALPRWWISDFLWGNYWLYIIIDVSIHTNDTSGRHKIRKYKKLHSIFSWTWSVIKPFVSLQWPNIIFQPQVAAICGRHKWLRVNVPLGSFAHCKPSTIPVTSCRTNNEHYPEEVSNRWLTWQNKKRTKIICTGCCDKRDRPTSLRVWSCLKNIIQ